jgi:hypothetical protein
MIVLNLSCSGGHHFEGWFASAESFTAQNEQGAVACPVCSDFAITRLPCAPRINRAAPATTRGAAEVPPADAVRVMVEKLTRLAAAADDVGERFAEEARRIHYREVPERAIRGRATHDETRQLLEEGIAVLPIPVAKESLN